MIKTKIFGNTVKEQMIASANDRLYNFLLGDGKVRGVILNATKMINEMKANFELGIIETLVLGHAYIAAGLLSSTLKGTDRIGIEIECSGVIKGLNVETNARNEVRGYLRQFPIPVDKPLDNFNLSPFFGAGFLTVTKYLEDSKAPFKGTVMLQYGNIAQDMAYYFASSEQVPTSFTLSIHFNPEGNVTGAGGMFLQSMPGTDQAVISSMEGIIKNLPSIGDSISRGKKPADIITDSFNDLSPKFLADTRVEFMCHCGKERMYQYLKTLPVNDISDILETGTFPLEIRCHNCNTKYYFDRSDMEKIEKEKQNKIV